MIPLVKTEVEKILFAQITRGANYRLFPLKSMVRNFRQFLKVVMIAILKKVNQLVISMEGRSFGLYKQRSTMSVTLYKWTDKAVIFTAITLILLAIIWR
jgi:energy-coupling factor transporter transmembrane protein EcfT